MASAAVYLIAFFTQWRWNINASYWFNWINMNVLLVRAIYEEYEFYCYGIGHSHKTMLAYQHSSRQGCMVDRQLPRCNISTSKNIRPRYEHVEMYIGNPKYTTFTKLVQVRNFITFEFKGFSTWGERDTIFLCWLLLHRQLSTQPTSGARSAQIRLASPSSECRLSRSETGTQLTPFSQILKILRPRFRCVTSLTSLWSQFLSGIFILTSLNDTSSPRAREHLRHVCT